jgi:hypothetical protein
MEEKDPLEYDRFTAANLNPALLEKVKILEEELRAETHKDVVLIAYEESQHNPS